MKSSKYILFDLDGTLTDPAEGITASVAYALKKFGITADKRELLSFIGPPLVDSFKEYYGFDREKALLAVKYYREYYGKTGIFENRLYDGIYLLLSELRHNGKKLILATSKPEYYAVKILKYFSVFEYFDFIAGATMDESRCRKSEIIAYAVSQCGISDTCSAVMVGDRRYDIEGAHTNSLKAVGVLFGYGSLDELTLAGADRLAESVAELKSILL